MKSRPPPTILPRGTLSAGPLRSYLVPRRPQPATPIRPGTMSAIPRCAVLVLLGGTFSLSPASSQELPLAHAFEVNVTYRADVPTPQEVIGHRIGDRHTRPHQLVDYFQALAQASDRVIVRQHALSH